MIEWASTGAHSCTSDRHPHSCTQSHATPAAVTDTHSINESLCFDKV